MGAYFTPGFFRFFRELKSHNDRAWFAENKARYVADVETPMISFITDFGERLRKISPSFAADPRRFGGSMLRIYRDTRFAADKSPFKTWTAAHFHHRQAHKNKDRVVPGFYLHLSPTDRYGGGGIYHPDRATLTAIRQRIVDDPRAWAKVRAKGFEIEGERLTRPPAGFDASHKYVDDLKRKDLYAGTEFSVRDVLSPSFLDKYTEACIEVAPLVEFLTVAAGLKW